MKARLEERLFCGYIGNITDEVIMEYKENQELEKDDEDFKVSES